MRKQNGLSNLSSISNIRSSPQVLKNAPPCLHSLLEWLWDPASLNIRLVTDQAEVFFYFRLFLSLIKQASDCLPSEASRWQNTHICFCYYTHYRGGKRVLTSAFQFPCYNIIFLQNRDQYGCSIAYHGSSPENWHSIVHRGLSDTFTRVLKVLFVHL